MIYEYRVYETMPGKLPELNARFRNHTLKLFERHGIKSIGYWTAAVGEYSDRLIYIVAFESPEQRGASHGLPLAPTPSGHGWSLSRRPTGRLYHRIFNTLLNPTDYSPLQ